MVGGRAVRLDSWEQFRLVGGLAMQDQKSIFLPSHDVVHARLVERLGPHVYTYRPSPYTCLVCRDTLIVRGHAWYAWRRAIGFREHTYCPVCMPGVFGPACEQPSLLSLELPHA